MSKNANGFTIVELLIVIVVVGILAAISIVAYNGVQAKARTSAVHSDLSNVKKKLMMFSADSGRYPVNGADLAAADLSIGSTSNYEMRPSYSNFYYCADVSGGEFAIGVRVGDGQGSSFYITSGDGITPRSGLINQNVTCSILGLAGTTSAQGAYSSSGIGATGIAAGWLRAGS